MASPPSSPGGGLQAGATTVELAVAPLGGSSFALPVRASFAPHLQRVIVFAHQYQSANASKVEYDRFDKWAARKRLEVSNWRAHDPEANVWLILVVDDSGGRALREFDWHGKMVTVAYQQAVALIERRLAQLATASRRPGEPVSLVAHYGPSVAPRLTPEGVWQTSKPGRG